MPERAAQVLKAHVAVVGAGPAGIAAAVSAAECGSSVVVIDAAPRAGGQIWRHRARGELGRTARTWLARLDASPATFIAGATIVDCAPGLQLTAEGDGGAFVIEAAAVVIASGAYERFLPFPGWTTPGVLGVGGIQALLKSGASMAGRRVVLAGSGPLLLPVAAALTRAGARVVMVAEQAPVRRVARFAAGLWSTPARLLQAAAYRGAFLGSPYRCGTWVARVEVEGGALAVSLTDGVRSRIERCDLLGVGYGLVPSTELPKIAGCMIGDSGVLVGAGQETTVAGVYCAGEPTGIAGAESAIRQGTRAGRSAAGERVASGGPQDGAFADRLARAFALRDELRSLPEPETIVCRCEDVRYAELRAGRTIRQQKLETRAGMGPCQGRLCGPAIRYLFGGGADRVQVPAFPASVDTLIAAGAASVPQGES